MSGQIAFPGTGRKRKREVAPLHPSLDALLKDRDAKLAEGGELAWQREKNRRRTELIARLRERRQAGYWTTGRMAA